MTVVTALCSLATFFDIRTCPGARAAQRQAWPGRQEAMCAGRGSDLQSQQAGPSPPGFPVLTRFPYSTQAFVTLG